MRVFFLNIGRTEESLIRRLRNVAYITANAKCFLALKEDDLLCLSFDEHVRYVMSFQPRHQTQWGTSLGIDGIARCDFFLDSMKDIPKIHVDFHFAKQKELPYHCMAQLGMFEPPLEEETEGEGNEV